MEIEKLIESLQLTFPPERLLCHSAQLATYESDGLTVFKSRPGAVVIPESQHEVVEAVKACHLHGVPFVARGSGTSLSGGSLPIEGGLVIALNKLNKILNLDPESRLAVVEP